MEDNISRLCREINIQLLFRYPTIVDTIGSMMELMKIDEELPWYVHLSNVLHKNR